MNKRKHFCLTVLLFLFLTVPILSKKKSESSIFKSGRIDSISGTLRINGRNLLDVCGNPLVIRGIEMPMWWAPYQIQWVDHIAATGANAMRILVNHEAMTFANVDSLFSKVTGYGMVIFWSVYTPPPGYGIVDYMDVNYWNIPEIKNLYQKYKKWIIVDAVQEVNLATEEEWLAFTSQRVNQLRQWGYDCPLDAISLMYGRNLRCLINQGAAAVAADPLHKLILGWQAYWYLTSGGEGCNDILTGYTNRSNWPVGWTYQGWQQISLCAAIDTIAALNFPIQLGILRFTEPGSQSEAYMDYPAAMAKTQEHGIGWLWWCWTGGSPDNFLSTDEITLNSLGQQVVYGDSNGIAATSVKARTDTIITSANGNGKPYIFTLDQNFPNPFNPSTTISFSVGTYGYTSLKIFDILGREIKTLVNEVKSPSTYNILWDGKNSAGQRAGSGVYFYQLKTESGFIKTQKMILLN